MVLTFTFTVYGQVHSAEVHNIEPSHLETKELQADFIDCWLMLEYPEAWGTGDISVISFNIGE